MPQCVACHVSYFGLFLASCVDCNTLQHCNTLQRTQEQSNTTMSSVIVCFVSSAMCRVCVMCVCHVCVMRVSYVLTFFLLSSIPSCHSRQKSACVSFCSRVSCLCLFRVFVCFLRHVSCVCALRLMGWLWSVGSIKL